MTSAILDRQCRNCKCGIRGTYQYCPHCGEKQGVKWVEPLPDDYFKPTIYTIGPGDPPIVTWLMQ